MLCLLLYAFQIPIKTMAFYYIRSFKENTSKSSCDMSKTKNNRKFYIGHMCCIYLQILFHVLQALNMATTDDIEPIWEFIPNAPQHVVVHRVDCSRHSIFYVIDICWKR